ncbi:uncharacterized protein J3D65DRAFT_620739 [Phyllosticta citribraziliensis]|uniref:Uncharacterized protein n=1 Tax=Phyllosticta citribraziliensis TaxID=989973 RepID=A0ABR1LZZ9_9PEZI
MTRHPRAAPFRLRLRLRLPSPVSSCPHHPTSILTSFIHSSSLARFFAPLPAALQSCRRNPSFSQPANPFCASKKQLAKDEDDNNEDPPPQSRTTCRPHFQDEPLKNQPAKDEDGHLAIFILSIHHPLQSRTTCCPHFPRTRPQKSSRPRTKTTTMKISAAVAHNMPPALSEDGASKKQPAKDEDETMKTPQSHTTCRPHLPRTRPRKAAGQGRRRRR